MRVAPSCLKRVTSSRPTPSPPPWPTSLPGHRCPNLTSSCGPPASYTNTETLPLDHCCRTTFGCLRRLAPWVRSHHPPGQGIALASELALPSCSRLADSLDHSRRSGECPGNAAVPPLDGCSVLYSTAAKARTRHSHSHGCAVAASMKCDGPAEAELPALAPLRSSCVPSDWGLGVDEGYAQG